ncbi:MAG: hypothetical protein H6713_32785 [Myxococcales bacterium]|nr:hypothetical protein [Myxococcales bacterium]MCB9754739.1 hypothetical protein [Myxococcales bacterium]
MLTNLIAQLRRVDVAVKPRAAPGGARGDGALELTVDGWVYTFAYESSARAPYPGELASLRSRRVALEREGLPLLVAPYVSRPLGERLSAAGWSWADHAGNFDLRGPDLRLSHTGEARPSRPRATLPGGDSGRAIIRCLLSDRAPAPGYWTTARLAQLIGVTPGAVSQVLSRLRELELVERPGHGRWRARAEPLLRAFQREYRGVRGTEHAWYSLDATRDVAERFASAFAGDVAISADVGPDLLAPWRVPTHLIIYARRELDPEALQLVPARGRADGNVFVRWPRDRSVFRPDASPPLASRLPLVDPVQQLLDLLELGGSDREEAARRLERWILERHES